MRFGLIALLGKLARLSTRMMDSRNEGLNQGERRRGIKRSKSPFLGAGTVEAVSLG
jgi:hypothetical protein